MFNVEKRSRTYRVFNNVLVAIVFQGLLQASQTGPQFSDESQSLLEKIVAELDGPPTCGEGSCFPLQGASFDQVETFSSATVSMVSSPATGHPGEGEVLTAKTSVGGKVLTRMEKEGMNDTGKVQLLMNTGFDQLRKAAAFWFAWQTVMLQLAERHSDRFSAGEIKQAIDLIQTTAATTATVILPDIETLMKNMTPQNISSTAQVGKDDKKFKSKQGSQEHVGLEGQPSKKCKK